MRYVKKSMKPDEIPADLKQEIIDLHQEYFNIEGHNIIGLMQARDQIDCYFDKKTNKLMGTIGLQTVELEKYVVLYIGNAVVRKECQQAGFLTRSIYGPILSTAIKNPLKKKFSISYSTSSNAYKYYSKFENAWPKPYEEIPENMQALMQEFCDKQEIDNIHISKKTVVVGKPVKEFKAKDTVIEEINDPYTAWFHESLRMHETGSQLMCLVAIDTVNVGIMTKAVINQFLGLLVPKNKRARRKQIVNTIRSSLLYSYMFVTGLVSLAYFFD